MTPTLYTPLQIVLCFNPTDRVGTKVRESIVHGFRGGEDIGGGYLAGGADLGVPVLEFESKPTQRVTEILDRALHSMVVLLVGPNLSEDDSFLDWLSDCGKHIEESSGRHQLLVIYFSDEWLGDRCPGLDCSQALKLHELGEESIRPASAGLMALNESSRILAQGSEAEKDSHLQLFLSHAKMDGQPIARALRDMADNIPGLKSFYDAEEIPPGSRWREILKNGALTSIVVVLRSEIFEDRPWCRQEVAWADEFASPIVVVDLRCRLIHPPSHLGLETAPSARVPDGNFFRIFYLGVREGLRVQLLRRTVHELTRTGALPRQTKVLPRVPSMLALKKASTELATQVSTLNKVIIYPDPPLSEGYYDAATALVESIAPGTRLYTPQSLIAES